MALKSLEWQMDAACRDHPRAADFYPPMRTERKHERLAREHRAKMICAACPVRDVCLAHALALDERYGVWGGLTLDERRAWPRSA